MEFREKGERGGVKAGKGEIKEKRGECGCRNHAIFIKHVCFGGGGGVTTENAGLVTPADSKQKAPTGGTTGGSKSTTTSKPKNR